MIGSVHGTAIRTVGAELRGVVGSSAQRSKALADQWQLPFRYPDLAAALDDEGVDVVHVCTPNGLHVAQAEAALRAGKHVVCEKPLATSAADAERLTALADEVGRVLAVPFVYRYHPIVREIRARRIAGEFGALHLLHGSYLQDWMLDEDAANWRVDITLGGRSRAFADIGSHWCDLVEWVAGVRFTEVSARLATTRPRRPVGSSPTFAAHNGGTPAIQSAARAPVHTEDVATMLLRTDGGVLGTLTVSQVSAGRKNRLWFELDGGAGSAVFDQEQPETAWLGDPSGARIIVRDNAGGSADQRRISSLPAGHAQGYRDCFSAFVADVYTAIDGAPDAGLPTGVDGVRSAHLVEAVLASSKTLAWTNVRATHAEELSA